MTPAQAGDGYLLPVSLATSSPLQKPENKGKHHICSITWWAQHFTFAEAAIL